MHIRRCLAFKDRVDMLRQTWLQTVDKSPRMDYGFFVEPGIDVSKLDNQVIYVCVASVAANVITIRSIHTRACQTFGDIHILQRSRDSSRKRQGGSGTNIDGLSFVSWLLENEWYNIFLVNSCDFRILLILWLCLENSTSLNVNMSMDHIRACIHYIL